jgi:hypothetical protein
MPVAFLRLIKRCAEFRPKEAVCDFPSGARGIYALLKFRPKVKSFDVVYVGMAGGAKCIKSRLYKHSTSVRKRDMWTHFSAYEVWENITEDEITELEGLFRAIYRKDSKANRLNKQKGFKKLRKVRMNRLALWAMGGIR